MTPLLLDSDNVVCHLLPVLSSFGFYVNGLIVVSREDSLSSKFVRGRLIYLGIASGQTKTVR